jgi:hypothetical protein
MQYLHLVNLAEQKLRSGPYAGRTACRCGCLALEAPPCAPESPFPGTGAAGLVTDGPFIETKEYLAGG